MQSGHARRGSGATGEGGGVGDRFFSTGDLTNIFGYNREIPRTPQRCMEWQKFLGVAECLVQKKVLTVADG